MSMPTYNQSHESVLRKTDKILELCKELDIDTVAGPATSGVLIAMACFMRSASWERPIIALLLGKQGYKRAKHSGGPKFLGHGSTQRIMLVDDVAESGDTFVHALLEIRTYVGAEVVACMSTLFSHKAICRIHNICPSTKIFNNCYSGVEEVDISELLVNKYRKEEIYG